MIELTTGVVFLWSSLYGAGQANANLASAATAVDMNQNVASSTSSITTEADIDGAATTSVEAYVRKEFADTPILIEVARCESRFHQFTDIGTVVRGIVNHGDVGVMQINEHYHADEAQAMGINIYTTEGNIQFGKYLYSKYGTDPWNSSSACWSQQLARK